LLALTIAVLVAAGILTGNPAYYARAWKFARIGIAAALIFFVVLIVSRFI
jgi:hypothetical protein